VGGGIGTLGGGPPPQSLVESVQDAWAAFARTGDPNVASLPDWPQYELPRRAAMELDVPPHVIDDIDGLVLETWVDVPIG
jgi:para-nitrobenzyl esterase